MTTLQQIIEAARRLPLEDRRQLREWLQAQERLDVAPPGATAAPPTAETIEQQLERFRKAMQWIDEHRAEYLGQWVALDGDRLISHGPDVLQVDAAARATGIAAPFLEQILAEEQAFCGGWA